MLVVSIVIVSCLCRGQCYQLESQGLQAADDGSDLETPGGARSCSCV